MTTFVDVIEAAYALDRSEESWLAGLAQTLGALYDGRSAAYIIRPDLPGKVSAYAAFGGWSEFIARGLTATREASPAALHGLYADGPFAGLASRKIAGIRADLTPFRESIDAVTNDQEDVVGVYGGVGLLGCMVCAPTRRGLPPRTQWALRRVAVHIAAAFRMRNAAGSDPEAILDEAGHVLEGDLKDEGPLLARAARGVAVARSRPNDDAAVGIWQGLVDGRWSLVRHFDSRGRRHLVVRRNEVEGVAGNDVTTRRVSSVLALAARGHSNKLIAYELGVPIATVASDLSRALRKLGLTRAELVRATGSS